MILPKNKYIILFDGVCNLCNSFVQFVIKFDNKDVFRFVSLQSEIGQEILKNIGLQNQNIDSVVFYESNLKYYIKSDAALEIFKKLGGFFYIFYLAKIFPKFIRNLVYDIIAKFRYKWFGRTESCMIPTEKLKSKFLT